MSLPYLDTWLDSLVGDNLIEVALGGTIVVAAIALMWSLLGLHRPPQRK